MSEFKFPLDRLPADASRNVLRTMDYGELIGFSLCSKSTKQKAVSLNYTATGLDLEFSDYCELSICGIADAPYNQLKARFESASVMKLLAPLPGRIERYAVHREYYNEKFEANDWIPHLASVFHAKNIKKIFIYEGTMTIENIRSFIGSMEFLTLHLTVRDHETTENLLKHFVPRDSIMNLGSPFQASSLVLLQNLKVLASSFCEKWKLNDLLMLNAKFAHLLTVTLTSKDWDRFLKLWMKGSNPYLIYLVCATEEGNFDEDEVKKGINGVQIPNDTKRTLERYDVCSRLKRDEVKGGFDIRRCDGTLATIFFGRANCFNLFIW